MTDRVKECEDMLRWIAGEGYMLTQPDRVRLVKLLGMLGSDHAGACDAAALAIERMRKERGLSWAEIFGVG